MLHRNWFRLDIKYLLEGNSKVEGKREKRGERGERREIVERGEKKKEFLLIIFSFLKRK